MNGWRSWPVKVNKTWKTSFSVPTRKQNVWFDQQNNRFGVFGRSSLMKNRNVHVQQTPETLAFRPTLRRKIPHTKIGIMDSRILLSEQLLLFTVISQLTSHFNAYRSIMYTTLAENIPIALVFDNQFHLQCYCSKHLLETFNVLG